MDRTFAGARVGIGMSVHAGFGERDAAFARLEQAYEERNPKLVGIRIDPMLGALRDDPRFAELVRRMNLPWP